MPGLFRKSLKEFTLVLGVTAVVEVLAWIVGLWSWTIENFQRWPWIGKSFPVIFCVLLLVAIVALRRWAVARRHLAVAFVGGAFCGLLASMGALLLIQAYRSELPLTELSDLMTLTYIALSVSLLVTVSWLHGSVTALLTGVAEQWIFPPRNSTSC